jgi:hypothetical protein
MSNKESSSDAKSFQTQRLGDPLKLWHIACTLSALAQ